MNGSRAYSRGTGGGRQLLHVRSLKGGVRTVEIYVNELEMDQLGKLECMRGRRTAGLATTAHDAHG